MHQINVLISYLCHTWAHSSLSYIHICSSCPSGGGTFHSCTCEPHRGWFHHIGGTLVSAYSGCSSWLRNLSFCHLCTLCGNILNDRQDFYSVMLNIFQGESGVVWPSGSILNCQPLIPMGSISKGDKC